MAQEPEEEQSASMVAEEEMMARGTQEEEQSAGMRAEEEAMAQGTPE